MSPAALGEIPASCVIVWRRSIASEALTLGAFNFLVKVREYTALLDCVVRTTLRRTAELGRAVYFSRSRGKLWFKGEESGHVQTVKEIRLDCDADVVLLTVEQQGGIACHTGRESCFFRRLEDGRWIEVDAVKKDPRDIYRK